MSIFGEYSVAARKRKIYEDFLIKKDTYEEMYKVLARGTPHLCYDRNYTEVEFQTFQDLDDMLRVRRHTRDEIQAIVNKIQDFRKGGSVEFDDFEMSIFQVFFNVLAQKLEEVITPDMRARVYGALELSVEVEKDLDSTDMIIKGIVAVNSIEKIKEFVAVCKTDMFVAGIAASLYQVKRSMFCYDGDEFLFKGEQIPIYSLMADYEGEYVSVCEVLFSHVDDVTKFALSLVNKFSRKLYKSYRKNKYMKKVFHILTDNSASALDNKQVASINMRFKNKVKCRDRLRIALNDQENVVSVADLRLAISISSCKLGYGPYQVLKDKCKPFIDQYVMAIVQADNYMDVDFCSSVLLYCNLKKRLTSGKLKKYDMLYVRSLIRELVIYKLIYYQRKIMITIDDRVDYMTAVMYLRGDSGIVSSVHKYDAWCSAESRNISVDVMSESGYKLQGFHESRIDLISRRFRFKYKSRHYNVNTIRNM